MPSTLTIEQARGQSAEIDWMLARATEQYREVLADYSHTMYVFEGSLPAQMASKVRETVRQIRAEAIDTQRGRFGGVWRPIVNESEQEREVLRIAVTWSCNTNRIRLEVDLYWEAGVVEQAEA